LRLFKDIFREVKAFDNMCGGFYKIQEAFIKYKRLFEDIFREMEALLRSLRLFQR
jgi:hypothetical protein